MVEYQREASNVRPYVRSSMYKIKWTLGLHHTFLCAVNYFGGKSKATSKRIPQHVNFPELTIAQVKSNLQLY
ncbi:putative Myb family transcription factor At1g14600 [Physcomitrium patens]|uniref:putative Myb family transcription factor At1g14600 n=1 Tax=Physcomitrium patens TaxID=3218 RepID=UPI003CCE4E42